ELGGRIDEDLRSAGAVDRSDRQHLRPGDRGVRHAQVHLDLAGPVHRRRPAVRRLRQRARHRQRAQAGPVRPAGGLRLLEVAPGHPGARAAGAARDRPGAAGPDRRGRARHDRGDGAVQDVQPLLVPGRAAGHRGRRRLHLRRRRGRHLGAGPCARRLLDRLGRGRPRRGAGRVQLRAVRLRHRVRDLLRDGAGRVRQVAARIPGHHRGERGGGGMTGSILDPVERAIADIRNGRPVGDVGDENRENQGDLIFAAAQATPELLAFTIRYTSGVICVPMEGQDLDRLGLPLMVQDNQERLRTAYTISVDARDGITTGISAADRAKTIRALADSATEPDELVRPGHIFPLRYREGGVLVRRGHTEAAVDLARLAGLAPAGVLAEVVNDDGTMARLPELRAFADEHGLALVSIEQLVDHRRRTETMVTRVAETKLPNEHGLWRAYGYSSALD